LDLESRNPEMYAGERFGMCENSVQKIVARGHKFPKKK